MLLLGRAIHLDHDYRYRYNEGMATMIVADTPLLNVTEAAERLRLTDGRIRQLLRSGELCGQKLAPRLWGIPVPEIERFEKDRENPPTTASSS